MKGSKTLVFAVALLLQGTIIAQSEFEGAWKGALAISEDISMRLEFIGEIAEDGSLTVLLNSPDNPALNNIPADSVVTEGNQITLEYARIGGKFVGSLENQTLSGDWEQPGASIPLELSLLVAQSLSPEAIAMLSGHWAGEMVDPNGAAQPVNFMFEMSEEGVMQAFGFETGGNQRQYFSGIILDGSTLSFDAGGAQFEAQISEANGIEGRLQIPQGGPTIPMTLAKNLTGILPEIPPPPPPPFVQNLSPEAIAMLIGDWSGSLVLPNREFPVTFRFEAAEESKVNGFPLTAVFNVAPDTPLTRITLEDSELSFVMAGASYTGAFNGATQIEGELLRANGSATALNLTKDPQ